MHAAIVPYEPSRLEALKTIVAHPSLASQMGRLRERANLERLFDDPYVDPHGAWLALDDGEPAGLAITLAPPDKNPEWSMLRLGVIDRFRRRGIGTALLKHGDARSRERGMRELSVGFVRPGAEAEAFAMNRGFARARLYWQMERPRGPIAAPIWPAGTTVRTYDGHEQQLRDLTDAYNAAFAGQYHGGRSTLEATRSLTTQAFFHADGLLLAYLDGRCVGFCRDSIFPERGEVDVLGVVPEAQSQGLGRALLRWGVAWLESREVPHVELMVEGGNDNALALYRSEGFAITVTREVWGRPVRA